MSTSEALHASRLAKHTHRKRVNAVAMVLCLSAMAFGLFWLAWILIETVRLGIGGLTLSIFTEMTPPPQAETGGLLNAIFGSLVMVGLATALGTPIGVMAGVYLAEYGQKTWLGTTTRFINDILLSAPSIVIGLFVYTVVVAPMKSFSGFAGVLALALIGMLQEIRPRSDARIMSLVIYAVMGWSIVFAIKPLIEQLATNGLLLLAGGGLSYTIGIIFYIFDSRFKHWHGIWHLFVLGGSLAHYLTIALYVV